MAVKNFLRNVKELTVRLNYHDSNRCGRYSRTAFLEARNHKFISFRIEHVVIIEKRDVSPSCVLQAVSEQESASVNRLSLLPVQDGNVRRFSISKRRKCSARCFNMISRKPLQHQNDVQWSVGLTNQREHAALEFQ